MHKRMAVIALVFAIPAAAEMEFGYARGFRRDVDFDRTRRQQGFSISGKTDRPAHWRWELIGMPENDEYRYRTRYCLLSAVAELPFGNRIRPFVQIGLGSSWAQWEKNYSYVLAALDGVIGGGANIRLASHVVVRPMLRVIGSNPRRVAASIEAAIRF